MRGRPVFFFLVHTAAICFSPLYRPALAYFGSTTSTDLNGLFIVLCSRHGHVMLVFWVKSVPYRSCTTYHSGIYIHYLYDLDNLDRDMSDVRAVSGPF